MVKETCTPYGNNVQERVERDLLNVLPCDQIREHRLNSHKTHCRKGAPYARDRERQSQRHRNLDLCPTKPEVYHRVQIRDNAQHKENCNPPPVDMRGTNHNTCRENNHADNQQSRKPNIHPIPSYLLPVQLLSSLS